MFDNTATRELRKVSAMRNKGLIKLVTEDYKALRAEIADREKLKRDWRMFRKAQRLFKKQGRILEVCKGTERRNGGVYKLSIPSKYGPNTILEKGGVIRFFLDLALKGA